MPSQNTRLLGAQRLIPGLVIVIAVAAVAALLSWLLSRLGATWVSAVFLAITIGITVRSAVGFRASWKPGTNFASVRLLRAGIVLLGVQFSLGGVISSGLNAMVAVVVIIAASALTVVVIRRVIRVGWKLSYLIAIGTAICGNSAIAATAPVIKARDEEVSYASFTITAFGMIAMLVYPLVGYLLGLNDLQFGMLAGAGIHDSAQSIASGFIFSEAAGGEAAIVKLTRVAFLAPIVLATAWCVAHFDRSDAMVEGAGARTAVPWFALGFVLLAAVRSVGDSMFENTESWPVLIELVRSVALQFIVAAMVAIGLSTDLTKLRSIGPRPFVIGLASSLIVGGIALSFAIVR